MTASAPRGAEGVGGSLYRVGNVPAPSMSYLVRVLRRQYRLVAAVTAFFLAGAIGYSVFAPRIFKASVSLLIDVRQDDPLHKESRTADSQIDTATIESQVHLMTSDAVVRDVVRKLKLADDPEFVQDNSLLPIRLVRQLIAFVFASGGSSSSQDIELSATRSLADSIKARRVGRTYIVDVDVLSRDPVKAATIANGVAKAYTDDQLNARIAAAERSAEWLKERAVELRQQSVDADRAVQTFTAKGDRERAELKSLETTAQAYRALFENYLKQYTTAVQQQSFPISFARVVTPAVAPQRKSYPRTTLLLLGALVAGAGVGGLAGFARESFRRTLNTEEDVREETGLTPIGALPEITNSRRNSLGGERASNLLEHLRPAGASGRSRVFVGQSNALMQIVRLYPHSRFAETIRGIKAAIALEGDADIRTIGVISARPGEGKTIVAANLAQYLASTGSRTILLDCNFRNPTLTEATPAGVDKADRNLAIDAVSGLAFQPVSAAHRGGSLADILTDKSVRAEMDNFSDRYDYVVVDLPCLESSIDARAVASIVDSCVIVCSTEDLQASRLTGAIDCWTRAGLSPLLGFVLNRVRNGREANPSHIPLPQVKGGETLNYSKAA